MKIGGNFSSFNISAEGLSVQRKKMNIISENIANADTIRDANGMPYQKKFLSVTKNINSFANLITGETGSLKMKRSSSDHITKPLQANLYTPGNGKEIDMNENIDRSQGEIVYMPGHPDADENGYVQMSNVNIITEMVDMIAATRSYEANLTAFNASKEIAKNSLEI